MLPFHTGVCSTLVEYSLFVSSYDASQKLVTFVLLAIQKALAGIQRLAFVHVGHLLENFIKVRSVAYDFMFRVMTDLQTVLLFISNHSFIQNLGAASCNILLSTRREGRLCRSLCCICVTFF